MALFVAILLALPFLVLLWTHADPPPPRAHGDPCAACGYPLEGLPLRAVCPECATPYAPGVTPNTRGYPRARAPDVVVSLAAAAALIAFADDIADAYNAFFAAYAPGLHASHLGVQWHGCIHRTANFSFLLPPVAFFLGAPSIRRFASPAHTPTIFIAGFLGATLLSLLIPLPL